MHSLKYSYATVNGLLLCEKKKAKDGNDGNYRTEFVDVVPLFHVGHGLTPMIEAALLQISAKCKERNLVIGGYYQANKYFQDSYPDVFAQRIGEKIWEQNNDAVLLMVHNFGLASSVQEESDAETALHLYTCNDSKWRQKTGSLRLDDPKKAFDCLNELIYAQQRHFDLIDFDNHLDDISGDWANKHINLMIDNTIKSL
jgi:hypothetical protein